MKALQALLAKIFKPKKTSEPPPAPPRDPVAAFRDSNHAAWHVVNLEARRDQSGYPILYELPANDGGGRWEIAGINERYHPDALARIRAAKPSEREALCMAHIEGYYRRSTGVERGMYRAGTDFLLMDITFNRGPGGAAWIARAALQALGAEITPGASFGPLTKKLLSDFDTDRPADLLGHLRNSRERYERERVGYRANLWRGLVNRWNKSESIAAELNAEEARLSIA